MDVYLDNSATTAVSPAVAHKVVGAMRYDYGNPSSLHRKGFEAQLILEEARKQVSHLLNCPPEAVYFTGSGSVANNCAILGSVLAKVRAGKEKQYNIVSTQIEHSSVLGPLTHLEERGVEVRLAKPEPTGGVPLSAISQLVDEHTVLVSAMIVNSETGALLDYGRLSSVVREKNSDVIIHCDAVQAFGRYVLSPAGLGIDMMSMSGHKIGAPKGIGGLYVRKGIRIKPLMFGGGQETGLMPGTENVPASVGFGLAAELIWADRVPMMARFAQLRERLRGQLENLQNDHLLCNNSPDNGAPYIMNISVLGLRSETLIHTLAQKGIYVSSGSACAKGKKSHVLQAMGLAGKRIDSALRVSMGPGTTESDIDAFIAGLRESIGQLSN